MIELLALLLVPLKVSVKSSHLPFSRSLPTLNFVPIMLYIIIKCINSKQIALFIQKFEIHLWFSPSTLQSGWMTIYYTSSCHNKLCSSTPKGRWNTWTIVWLTCWKCSYSTRSNSHRNSIHWCKQFFLEKVLRMTFGSNFSLQFLHQSILVMEARNALGCWRGQFTDEADLWASACRGRGCFTRGHGQVHVVNIIQV